MKSKQRQSTTIAISRKNHLELSELCKKGQTFDSVLTDVLNELKENKNGQSKYGVDRSDALTSKFIHPPSVTL